MRILKYINISSLSGWLSLYCAVSDYLLTQGLAGRYKGRKGGGGGVFFSVLLSNIKMTSTIRKLLDIPKETWETLQPP